MSQELRVLIIEDDPDVRLGCEQAMMLADIRLKASARPKKAFSACTPAFPA